MLATFINPPFKPEYGRFSRSSRSPAITKGGTLYYPMWLAYAAAYLESNAAPVAFIDSCAGRLTAEQTIAAIDPSTKLFVLDTSTPSITSDIAFARQLKERFPLAWVIVMGTHVTATPKETLDGSIGAVDAVVVGEADAVMLQIYNAIKSAGVEPPPAGDLVGRLRGVATRVGGEVIVNPKADPIKDLDALPWLSKFYAKHLNIRDYFFAACKYPVLQLMTSRGCVAQCSFCVYPHTIHNLKYRMRTAQSVFEEMRWITENLPEVKQVGFEDDVFSGSVKRTKEFCELMIRSGLNKKIIWYSNERASMTREMLALMKQAGCELVIVGYESANQTVLDNINKKIKLEQMLAFSKSTSDIGIRVHGCFMVGNYGETEDTLDETLRLSLKFKDDTIQFFPLIVYPGTPDYKRFKDAGLYTARDYDDYLTPEGMHKSVVRTVDLTGEELTDWCNEARKRYYLRWGYIKFKLKKILIDPADAQRTFKSFAIFWRHLFFPKRTRCSTGDAAAPRG